LIQNLSKTYIRELKSFKKRAGAKCPDRKRLTILWVYRAPMGLIYLSKMSRLLKVTHMWVIFSIKREGALGIFGKIIDGKKLCWQGPYDELLVIIGLNVF
jgi:hypothetical protein